VNVTARHIAIWTLLAVAVVFGHDVLMAAGPHRDPMAATAHFRSSHDADHHHEAPAATCHATEGAWPAGVSPVGNHDVATADSWADTVDASRDFAPGWWATPPGRPPDVLRALLQVFLN
jgi:hypothetical protein